MSQNLFVVAMKEQATVSWFGVVQFTARIKLFDKLCGERRHSLQGTLANPSKHWPSLCRRDLYFFLFRELNLARAFRRCLFRRGSFWSAATCRRFGFALLSWTHKSNCEGQLTPNIKAATSRRTPN